MSDLRILVVDDREEWREELQQILGRIGPNVKVDVAATYDDAYNAIHRDEYSLITMDIALVNHLGDQEVDADRSGMKLLEIIRNSNRNRHSSIIVVTGIATVLLVNEAHRRYHIHNLVEKDKFQLQRQELEEAAREAIRDTQLKIAEERARERWRVVVTFDETHLLSGDVFGPQRPLETISISTNKQELNIASLSRRADNINIFLTQEAPDANIWREELRFLGNELHESFRKEPNIQRSLDMAEAFAQQSGKNFWLQLNGPAVGLGVPFELLRDGSEYLSLRHIVTRRLKQNKPMFFPKPPFHTFLQQLLQRQEKLRILLVSANHDGGVPEAEQEVKELRESIDKDLRQIGIRCDIDLLVGEEASNTRVRHALRNGHYHIFHYAGHGLYRDALPETSGLILHDNSVLTAGTLNTLVRDSDLYMVFLSCCLSARNSTQIGRGDFHGMLEAVASANVPVVLGYRWVVMDDSALQIAKTFYETLWRTFSPGDALLEARIQATIGDLGRDDETWASLVMIMQTA